jgi:eukaryotic-like serine/threonine-protein kinase
MNDEQKRKLPEIFSHASELQDEAEREAYLASACSGDAELRAAVDSLLAAAVHADERLPQTLVPPPEPLGEAPGKTIGRYKLVEQIGEGAFGVVFIAEQREPVKRRVALKVIKAGMDTREVVGRFEAERQALALMDHPNIAKVLDAGTTETGRPYFVMELIQGVPVTEYCDRERLTTKQRLELFMQICQAVQHAHQKGIIHRDLKPTNVLVSEIDGKAVPKIIDFGIAKALGWKLTEKTLFTSVHQMFGTPAYMSPEQAELGGLDVDTRSDIYSLGVLLYELLTGMTPFDAETLAKAALDEVRRVIREVEPPKPSTRLKTLGPKLTEIAERRKTDAGALPRVLQGDLDWIVMSALDKDRTRRYATATALSEDVQRHLAHEPVSAGAPSRIYRAGKFLRRHRLGVAMSAVLVLILLLSTTASLLQFTQARRERARARAAEGLAQKHADMALALNQFLTRELIGPALPGSQPDPNITLRTVLDVASKNLQTTMQKAPGLEVPIRGIFADTYAQMGEYTKARAQVERAIKLLIEQAGVESPDVLAVKSELARLLFLEGQRDAAEKVASQLLEVERRVLGPDDPGRLKTLSTLAQIFQEHGKSRESEQLWRQASDLARRAFGEDSRQFLQAMHKRAIALSDLGELGKAEDILRSVVNAEHRVFGNPDADTLNSLAGLIHRRGRVQEALDLFSEVSTRQQRELGAEHPDTLRVKSNLIIMMGELGRYDEAKALAEEVFETQRRVLGPEHPHTLDSMLNLAVLLHEQRRYPEAHGTFEDLIGIQKRINGPHHLRALVSMRLLAECYLEEASYGPALKLSTEVLEEARQVLSTNSPELVKYLELHAIALIEQGSYEESRVELEKILPSLRRIFGDKNPYYLKRLGSYCKVLWALQDYVRAQELGEDIFANNCRVLGEKAPHTLGSAVTLWRVYCDQRKYKKAREVYDHMLEARSRELGPMEPGTREVIDEWEGFWLQQGYSEEIRKQATEKLRADRELLGPANPFTHMSTITVGVGFLADGQLEAVRELYGNLREANMRQFGAGHLQTMQSAETFTGTFSYEGDWKTAAKLLAGMPQTNRFDFLFRYALNSLLADDVLTYGRCCEAMAGDFGRKEPEWRELTARIMLLAPQSLVDSNQPFQLVNYLFEIAPPFAPHQHIKPWFQFTKGLAEYRAGRGSEAIQWLKGLEDHPDDILSSTASCVLALAHAGLGQMETAACYLAFPKHRLSGFMHRGALAQGIFYNQLTFIALEKEAEIAVFGRSSPPLDPAQMAANRRAWRPVSDGLRNARQLLLDGEWRPASLAFSSALTNSAFNWDSAAMNFPSAALWCGVAFLRDGNLEMYRHLCQSLSRHYSDLPGTRDAATIPARVYLLSPSPGSEWIARASNQLAKVESARARLDWRGKDWLSLQQGLLAYRSGRYADAASMLGAATNSVDMLCQATSIVLQGMACKQMGQEDSAARLLQAANDLIPELVPTPGLIAWEADRQVLLLLWDEARGFGAEPRRMPP